MELEPTQQQVFAWGKNDGKLLLKSSKKTKLTVPQNIKIQHPIQRICSIQTSTYFLTQNQSVYELKNNILNKIPEFNNIIKIVCGQNHILALSADRKVYSWGEGKNGCLGNGSLKYCDNPNQILLQQNIIDIYCGSFTSFFITDKQQIYACGSNRFGQLAHSSFKCHLIPSKIETKNIKIIQIAGGIQHTLFLSIQGNIYCVGNGKDGRLGISNQKDINYKLEKIQSKQKFKSIYSGNYCAAINQKGQIFIWGKSIFGNFKQPTLFLKINKVFKILSLYQDNGYALTKQGQVWVWGNNLFGQLGVGDTEVRFKPFPLIILENKMVQKIFAGPNCAFCITNFQKKKKIKVLDKIYKKSSAKKTIQNNYKSYNNSIEKPKGIRTNRSKIESGYKSSKKKRKNTDKIIIKQNKLNQLIPSQIKYATLNPNSYENSQIQFDSDTINVNQSILQKQTIIKKTIQESEFERLIRQLQQSRDWNKHLVQQIKQKDFLIQDITSKIKLLQDAIQKKQSQNENNNEKIVQQMKNNEKRYLRQIQKLNSSIMVLINTKQNNNMHKNYLQLSQANGKLIRQLQLQNQQYVLIIKQKTAKLQQQQRLIQIMKQQIDALQIQLKKKQQQQIVVTSTLIKNNQKTILQQNKKLNLQLKDKIAKQSKQIQKNSQKSQQDLKIKVSNLQNIISQKDQIIQNLRIQLQVKVLQIQKLKQNFQQIQSIKISKRNSQSITSSNVNSYYAPPPQNRQILSNITIEVNDKQNKNISDKKSRVSKKISRQNNQNGKKQIERSINKIEQNRRKIDTSANKLIHILDMSM